MNIRDIAMVAHAANKAYCEAIGDYTHWSWSSSSLELKESTIAGVQSIVDGAHSPEEQHRLWLEHKEDQGWVWGPFKHTRNKTHPCMLPYEELPAKQKLKDALFQAVVGALL